MITLCGLGRQDLNRVAHIETAPEHVKFAGTVQEAFRANETGVDFHAICEADHPVGFFKIDRLYHKKIGWVRAGELGLRAFMIDRSQQGRGLATRAVRALGPYLRATYPDAPALLLTVNKINAPAIACYLKGGFHHTGQTWPHGQAGPQHVMRMRLHAP